MWIRLLLLCLFVIPVQAQTIVGERGRGRFAAAAGDPIADNCTTLLDFDPENQNVYCGASQCTSDYQRVDSIQVTGSRAVTLTAGNAASRPFWNDADTRFNGLNSITFGANSVAEQLDTGGADDAFTALPEPRTYYAVIYDSVGSATDRYLVDGHVGAAASDRHILYKNASDKFRTVVFDDAGSTMAGVTSVASIADATLTILTYVMNDASSENSIDDANTTADGTAGTTTNHTSITIGNSKDDNRSYGVQIGRILICDGAHDASAQDAITDELGTLYGSASLPD